MTDLPLPEVINKQIIIKVEKWLSQLSITDQQFIYTNTSIKTGIKKLFAISQYVTEYCIVNPQLLLTKLKDNSLFQRINKSMLMSNIKKILPNTENEEIFMKSLRFFRHQQLITILWQSINQQIPIQTTMQDLSKLAEVCLEVTLNWLYNNMKNKFGTPYGETRPQKMVILGLGKLGGKELNFSSDIDLIFCYPQAGYTQGGSKNIENQVFFQYIGQALIKILSTVTNDGFVYRMDLRLRPYGSDGALVWSFAAMEQYYQDQGRDWERYALIKARPVAGDKAQGSILLNILRPFIYRRYIDFSAVKSLREMKFLLHEDELTDGMNKNIKLGSGGIREVEFIIQSFQLIYGGKKPQLQNVNLLKTLTIISNMQLLDDSKINLLRSAYLYFRHFEHLLQVWEDRQTHDIPKNDYQKKVLAYGMQCHNWSELYNKITFFRKQIKSFFQLLMSFPQQNNEKNIKWRLLWEKRINVQEAINLLKKQGFQQAETIYNKLIWLRDNNTIKNISSQSLSRINLFIPTLLTMCSSLTNADQALLGILPFVTKVLRRTSYLLFLIEKPDIMLSLIQLCGENEWISEEIAKYPSLIDEFLDQRDLKILPSTEWLQNELLNELAITSIKDIENRLKHICYFKIKHHMKSMIAKTNEWLSPTEISYYLTRIAECVVQEVANMAWLLLTHKHGFPSGYNHREPPYIILGYGKLGGMEIGPESDLDLVFIHNTKIQQMTMGEHALENQTFFTLLVQKIIYWLSTVTTFGKLYQVDLRLRPSGNSGLMVSSFTAFKKYLHQSAWLWEHQALIKARVINAKKSQLAQKFILLRSITLQKKRDNLWLQQNIKEMRNKMLILDKTSNEQFNLKYSRGGMIDIEFIIQYLILREAHQHPILIKHTNYKNLLTILQKKQILKEAHTLNNIYISLLTSYYQINNCKKNAIVQNHNFIETRKLVINLWNKYLNDGVLLK